MRTKSRTLPDKNPAISVESGVQQALLPQMRRAYSLYSERRPGQAQKLCDETRAAVFDLPEGDERQALEAEWHFLCSLLSVCDADGGLAHMEHAAKLACGKLTLLKETEPFLFGCQPFALLHWNPGAMAQKRQQLVWLTQLYAAHTHVGTQGMLPLFDTEYYRYRGDAERAEMLCFASLHKAKAAHLDVRRCIRRRC